VEDYDDDSDAYFFSPTTKDKGEDGVPGTRPLGWLVDSCPGNRDYDEKEDLSKVCGCNDETATTERGSFLQILPTVRR